MNHIVLDLEWNQAADAASTVTQPLRLSSEIVQIGAVKLNAAWQVTDTFKLTVRPAFYKTVHFKVRQLTGLRGKDLAGGEDFVAAIHSFLAWCGPEFDLFSWGPDDHGVLRDNLLIHGLSANLVPPCRDLQLIFDDQITRLGRQIALKTAVEAVGLTLSDAHDALADALATAGLCAHLDMAKGLGDYPALADRITPPSLFSLSLSTTYSTKQAALKDPALRRLEHPTLTGTLFCTDWVADSVWKYLALGSDEGKNTYFVTLKFARSADGRLSVRRTVHPLNQKLHAIYKEKSEKHG